MKRKKVGVYIDYVLRVPDFNKAYSILKENLFNTNDQFEIDKDLKLLNFWQEEVKNPDVEKFYLNKELLSDNLLMKDEDWSSWFFNKEHFNKFIDDFSFYLYVDCDIPNKRDIEILNIAQVHLFDIDLIDTYALTRKKSNTLFFLSKIRVFPKSITFIHEEDTINEEEYYGIWNPLKNKSQKNEKDLGEFENWFIELETKLKNG